jgi:hypothetical protein
MTDANTDGARMVAACTSGDEATVRELPARDAALGAPGSRGTVRAFALRRPRRPRRHRAALAAARRRCARGRGTCRLGHSTENRGRRRRPRVQRSRGAHRQGDRGTTALGALGRPLTARSIPAYAKNRSARVSPATISIYFNPRKMAMKPKKTAKTTPSRRAYLPIPIPRGRQLTGIASSRLARLGNEPCS